MSRVILKKKSLQETALPKTFKPVVNFLSRCLNAVTAQLSEKVRASP